MKYFLYIEAKPTPPNAGLELSIYLIVFDFAKIKPNKPGGALPHPHKYGRTQETLMQRNKLLSQV